MLQIGQKTSIPPDYITKVVSFLAMRGAGKTYGCGVIEEEILDYINEATDNNANIVVIDPVGAHWGIRSHYPIHILGGIRSDITIDLDSGKLFAEMVQKFNLNIILDVSEFQQDDMVQFVADFLTTYYQLNKTPTHIFIEEADVFAPQRMTSKAQKASLAAVDTVVRRGRGRGIGVTMVTQRPAVLNKNVLTQSDAAIIMNMTGETDLKVVGEYLNSAGATKKEVSEYIEKIMKFNKGQALIFSPSWLKEIKVIKFREKVSFHAGAEPKLGEDNPADKIKLIHMAIEPLIHFLNGDKEGEIHRAEMHIRENKWSQVDEIQRKPNEWEGDPNLKAKQKLKPINVKRGIGNLLFIGFIVFIGAVLLNTFV